MRVSSNYKTPNYARVRKKGHLSSAGMQQPGALLQPRHISQVVTDAAPLPVCIKREQHWRGMHPGGVPRNSPAAMHFWTSVWGGAIAKTAYGIPFSLFATRLDYYALRYNCRSLRGSESSQQSLLRRSASPPDEHRNEEATRELQPNDAPWGCDRNHTFAGIHNRTKHAQTHAKAQP